MRNVLRREPAQSTTVIRDLDKIHSETVSFRLNGKVHKIKPLTQLEFFQYVEAYNAFIKLAELETLNQAALDEGFYNVFRAAVSTISKDDVVNSTRQQSAALFGLIMETVTGKPQDIERNDLKKKVS